MHIDFTHIKSIVTEENDYSLRLFEETSKDLSNYLENIKNRYNSPERNLNMQIK